MLSLPAVAVCAAARVMQVSPEAIEVIITGSVITCVRVHRHVHGKVMSGAMCVGILRCVCVGVCA